MKNIKETVKTVLKIGALVVSMQLLSGSVMASEWGAALDILTGNVGVRVSTSSNHSYDNGRHDRYGNDRRDRRERNRRKKRNERRNGGGYGGGYGGGHSGGYDNGNYGGGRGNLYCVAKDAGWEEHRAHSSCGQCFRAGHGECIETCSKQSVRCIAEGENYRYERVTVSRSAGRIGRAERKAVDACYNRGLRNCFIVRCDNQNEQVSRRYCSRRR